MRINASTYDMIKWEASNQVASDALHVVDTVETLVLVLEMRSFKVFLKVKSNVCLIWVCACHFKLETWFQIKRKFSLALDCDSTAWSRLSHDKSNVFIHLAASTHVSALYLEFGFFFIAEGVSRSTLESLAHRDSKWNHKSIVGSHHRKRLNWNHKLLKLG